MSEFLRAEWRKLIMVNYEVPKDVLIPYLPKGVELDYFNDKLYVSLVGFLFKDTHVKGYRIPGHINFEEVNLRFYVKHEDDEEIKRGVVFIQEIVPKVMISTVANLLYGEHYTTKRMRHKIERKENLHVAYSWRKSKKWNLLHVESKPVAKPVVLDSKAHFITEHFWGYTKKNEYKTSEYEVGHPTWKMYDVINYNIRVDFAANYGREFAFLNEAPVDSVMLAEGSEIFVKKGQTIN